MENCCKPTSETTSETVANNTVDTTATHHVCFICKDNVTVNTLTYCTRCNIVVHLICSRKFDKDRKYSMCPKCNRVGTMGCSQEVHIYHGCPKDTWDKEKVV
jgi:hypothetical protein